jgi:hypothetical protein
MGQQLLMWSRTTPRLAPASATTFVDGHGLETGSSSRCLTSGGPPMIVGGSSNKDANHTAVTCGGNVCVLCWVLMRYRGGGGCGHQAAVVVWPSVRPCEVCTREPIEPPMGC